MGSKFADENDFVAMSLAVQALDRRITALGEWQKATDFKELRDMVGVRLGTLERLWNALEARLNSVEKRWAQLPMNSVCPPEVPRCRELATPLQQCRIPPGYCEQATWPKCETSAKPDTPRKARAGDVVKYKELRLIVAAPGGLEAKDAENRVQCGSAFFAALLRQRRIHSVVQCV